jgi:hypothetical protein
MENMGQLPCVPMTIIGTLPLLYFMNFSHELTPLFHFFALTPQCGRANRKSFEVEIANTDFYS